MCVVGFLGQTEEEGIDMREGAETERRRQRLHSTVGGILEWNGKKLPSGS